MFAQPSSQCLTTFFKSMNWELLLHFRVQVMFPTKLLFCAITGSRPTETNMLFFKGLHAFYLRNFATMFAKSSNYNSPSMVANMIKTDTLINFMDITYEILSVATEKVN